MAVAFRPNQLLARIATSVGQLVREVSRRLLHEHGPAAAAYFIRALAEILHELANELMQRAQRAREGPNPKSMQATLHETQDLIARISQKLNLTE